MGTEKETWFKPEIYDGYSGVRHIDQSEEERPYNFLEIVRKYAPGRARLLDAGCGNAFKLEELAAMGTDIERFVGFDINAELSREAFDNAFVRGLNLDIVRADTNSPFPFPDNYFDVVTFMLARHNAQEAHRVLTHEGVVIMERVGEEDKREAKELFGSDGEGPRGYLLDKAVGDLMKEYVADFRSAGFTIVEYLSGKWKTWVDKSGLISLLQNTPFVRNFDRVLDDSAIDKVVAKFTTPRGIELTQHRIVLIARK
jgi:SAM-dependent methyltransferase